MADNRVIINIEFDDKGGIAKLSSLTKGFKDLDYAANGASNAAKKLEKNLKSTFNGKIPKQIKVTKKEYKNLSNELTNLSNKNGAATSATLELGRVLSDMPYGIRGVANNLQQLGANLFYMSKATDKATGKAVGLGGAFKTLIGGLIGPAGILVAFQGIIALFDYLSTKTKKATLSVSELKESFKELAKIIKRDTNASITDYIKLMVEKKRVEKLAEESANDIIKIDKQLNQIKRNRIVFEKQLLKVSKEQKEFVQNQLIALTEKENKLNKEKEDIIRGVATEYNNLTDATKKYNEVSSGGNEQSNQEGTIAWYNEQISKEKKLRDERSLTSVEYAEYTKRIKAYEEEIKAITGNIDKREKVSVQFDLEPIDPSKLSKQAQEFIDTFKKYTSLEIDKNPLDVSDFIPEDLSEETKEKIKKYKKKLYADMALTSDLDDFGDFAEEFQKGLTAISDFAQAQFDRQLTIEENKTNVLNEQLNQRLLNENLSAEERKKIQNEILQNDEALRKKQNEINKKKFLAQKAFNISMAVVDTAKAAAEVMAKTPGEFFTKLAAAKLTIAFGLAQVATIASQKFQPQGASTPANVGSIGGGGTGGVGDRSFDFNLVGATQGNQLLDAIQGQFNKPVQAYVVSRDMTSQQQLDANIKNQASF